MPKCRMKKPTAAQTQYWEARLKRMGLGMDAGHSRSTITYGHMIEHFGELEGKIIYSPPTGERTDTGECVISTP